MRKKVSIAMAVYNGEKYLNEQIDSILQQLVERDELIISYDKSSDNSLKIIKAYASKDHRIKYFYNNLTPGVVKNFENAVRHCTGEIIFYSDQDDIWMSDKIKKVLSKFEDPNVTVVIHDSSLTDSELNILYPSTFKLRNGNTSIIKNFIRLSYIGCSMAFRSTMLPVILPLPTKKRSHDWWTGTICSCFGKMEMINDSLILHRIHEDNVTPKKRPSLKYQLEIRRIIFVNTVKRYFWYRKLIKKNK